MSKVGIAIFVLILAAGCVGLLMLYLSPASTKLNTTNSDSSNPGYPFELLDEGPRWKRIGLAVAAVLACMLVAAVVVPR